MHSHHARAGWLELHLSPPRYQLCVCIVYAAGCLLLLPPRKDALMITSCRSTAMASTNLPRQDPNLGKLTLTDKVKTLPPTGLEGLCSRGNLLLIGSVHSLSCTALVASSTDCLLALRSPSANPIVSRCHTILVRRSGG